MNYKVIDGVLYEVKEADVEQLKIEFIQGMKVVDEQKKRIEANNKQIEALEQQYDAQIESYKKQKESIDKNIEMVLERKEQACDPYRKSNVTCEAKINEVKSRLADKEEAIRSILPEAAEKLGF